MRNYKRWMLCSILCFMMLFVACGKTSVSDTDGKENPNSQGEEHLQEVVLQKSAILKDASKIDKDGHIFYVKNDRIESSLQQEIALFDGNLLLWGYGENSQGETGFHVSLISLQTGEVLREKTFSGLELPNAQVCGDKIAINDWGLGKVTILDKNFKVIKEYETNTSYCSIYLNEDATKIHCFTQQGVKRLDIESGEEEILFANATMLFASSKCGDAVSITYTDKNTQMNESGIVELSTGKAEKVPYEGAFHSGEYNSGVWLAGLMGEENQYYLGKADRPKIFAANEQNGVVTLLANPLRLMSTTYDRTGKTTMTLYSLEGGFLSASTLPETASSVMYEPIWSEADGGYFLLAIDDTGKDMLMFWDMSVPATGKDLTLISAYKENASTDSKVSKALLERAEKLGKTYDVDILLGDQIMGTYTDYNVMQEMDNVYISDGLDAVEQALAQYPKGFMRQLLYGSQRSLEIHLGGAFTVKELPDGEINGFTSYIGLAEEQEDKTVIVLDITQAGSIEQTLHHEIMHVIDYKLSFDARVREDAVYSEEAWSALNPKGFSYVEDKFHLPKDIYKDGHESYFIDIYSRVNAKEDRARIMEYAMVDADWAFSSADGRCEKLEFLCQCIRDAFDTDGWPSVTKWEKTLERSR